MNDYKSHPTLTHRWNRGQRAADKVTEWIGSWKFIIIFIFFLIIWTAINAYFFMEYSLGKPWDPYPFILLNLILSCIAALQAPIILMSQNRETQKDRLRAQYDYQVNKKAEKEIEELMKEVKEIKTMIKKK